MIAGEVPRAHLILEKDMVGIHDCLCFGFTKEENIF